jgi:hypothetical protein
LETDVELLERYNLVDYHLHIIVVNKPYRDVKYIRNHNPLHDNDFSEEEKESIFNQKFPNIVPINIEKDFVITESEP